MRTIQMTCSRYNATMFLEKNRGFSSLSCPYCGGILSPISSNVDGKRYFLYACDKCTRKEKEERK